jgi:mono/diheme cytochrome c family protein
MAARKTAAAVALLAVAAAIAWYVRTPGPSPAAPAGKADAGPQQEITRGAYLVRAGNCYSCHTVPDGKPYAGGRAIPTPFGTLYSSNLTPDPETGIGTWSAEDFWRALHEGKSRDGSLLYPAFPYTNYTKVSREDANAIYAWLRTLAPVTQASRPQEMRFPYDKRSLLAGWRALYFKEGAYQDDPKQSAQWNRGAYLAEGLGHCNACHAARNAWGAVKDDQQIGGGLIPMLNWYAPALASKRETGLGAWPVAEIVALLKTGVAHRGAVFGPMSEVVRDSLQHLTEEDVTAMAVYLKSRPADEAPESDSGMRVTAEQKEAMDKLGARIYKDNCAGCHQSAGEGVPRIYPPFAGNEAILMRNPVNAIRITLNGGFPPSTKGNPRPFGMPPFAHLLGDDEVAAAVTYIRGAWGNNAAPVAPAEVAAARGVPLE